MWLKGLHSPCLYHYTRINFWSRFTFTAFPATNKIMSQRRSESACTSSIWYVRKTVQLLCFYSSLNGVIHLLVAAAASTRRGRGRGRGGGRGERFSENCNRVIIHRNDGGKCRARHRHWERFILNNNRSNYCHGKKRSKLMAGAVQYWMCEMHRRARAPQRIRNAFHDLNAAIHFSVAYNSTCYCI